MAVTNNRSELKRRFTELFDRLKHADQLSVLKEMEELIENSAPSSRGCGPDPQEKAAQTTP